MKKNKDRHKRHTHIHKKKTYGLTEREIKKEEKN